MVKYMIRKTSGKTMKDVAGKSLTWDSKISAQRYISKNFQKGYKGKIVKRR